MHPVSPPALPDGTGDAAAPWWRRLLGLRQDRVMHLATLAAVLLFLVGIGEAAILVSLSAVIADRVPGAILKEYPGAGHAFQTQCREEFIEDLLSFLG